RKASSCPRSAGRRPRVPWRGPALRRYPNRSSTRCAGKDVALGVVDRTDREAAQSSSGEKQTANAALEATQAVDSEGDSAPNASENTRGRKNRRNFDCQGGVCIYSASSIGRPRNQNSTRLGLSPLRPSRETGNWCGTELRGAATYCWRSTTPKPLAATRCITR